MDGSWFCNSKGRWIVMKETDGVEVDLMSVMKTEESQVLIISEDEFCTDEEVANEAVVMRSSHRKAVRVHRKTLRITKKTKSMHKM